MYFLRRLLLLIPLLLVISFVAFLLVHAMPGGPFDRERRPASPEIERAVKAVIAQGLPVSMSLGFLAFGFALGIGLPLGYFSAVRRGHWQDYAGSFFAILVVCVPGLVVGPLLVMSFALKWRLLPVALWGSPGHAILP